ncbi:unnamed protein product [Urochloa decumbens]|uniref:DUF7595 domain-containing protein n=1 Tax=Urochloa decumbens TaxID=240449 RepID=A0ABC9G0A4_9POAL
MAGGGSGDAPKPPGQASGGRRRRHQAASLPLDVMADIAARTDPVTLVRCAATCGDLRGRVADPAFRRRLRLRHADRFVFSLLRGHLIGDKSDPVKGERMYLVDAAAAGTAVGLLSAAECFLRGPDGEPLQGALSAHDGLVLVKRPQDLCVCNLATGRSQTIPPAPGFGAEFTGCNHVLLVGDDSEAASAVGRPFQVVMAHLELEQRHRRRLQVQTFSSEQGTWGRTEIRTPQIQGQIKRDNYRYYAPGEQGPIDNALRGGPLVVGSAVHWLCLTDSAGYVLRLRIRAAAAAAEAPRLTVTKLPESYPYKGGWTRHLLATVEAGGRPAVLVADGNKILAWTQSKHTASWNRQPQVVIEYEEMSRFIGDPGEESRLVQLWKGRQKVSLVWFAELIRMYDDYLFWLDLQSMEIVRWSSDPQICRNKTTYCPCEMDLATWIPTFSSSM